jgi:hypothetical protein
LLVGLSPEIRLAKGRYGGFRYSIGYSGHSVP